METSGRNADATQETRDIASEAWTLLFNNKLKVVRLAMDTSGSVIKPHKVLILVDLQGVYFGLQNWLHENKVPMEDGAILSSFAQAQIERTGKEIASRVVNAHSTPAYDLSKLLDAIEISYIDGKASLGKELKVAKDSTYLDISMFFEMFYAPVPLSNMEWQLKKSASRGNPTAQDQVKKIGSGIVTRKGVFERDYKVYSDFVDNLKQSPLCSGSHKGFFNYYIGPDGLRNFDEKEVDTRIVVRAMDALYKNEADSLCIISSDQDFIPLHEKADEFGVTSYQVDLSKFTEQDRVGKRIKDLKDRFIQCGIDPNWPLQVLLDGLSAPADGHLAKYNFSRAEWDSLCALHNSLNDWNIGLIEDGSGKLSVQLHRPPVK